MPGVNPPVGQGPGGIPVIWNTVMQGIARSAARLAALESARYAGAPLIDAYGNTLEISGTNLAGVVFIGASHGQPGVQVGTGLTGTARAKQTGLVTTTITLTKGSFAATVASGTGLSAGMVIGAANVSDPSSGTATPAITPGTTIQAITGTSVTLSQKAAETGTGLFCAACNFTKL